ncbi:MAG: AAA family ATPase [Rhodospirillaceae bacterium]|nr:AAA family ATPase [Rhodospirillaceae bacterium]
MNMTAPKIIVIGNEKGGSGKSTTAMHLAVSLMRAGHRVACMDLDIRQGTLTRYFENRENFATKNKLTVPMPSMIAVDRAWLKLDDDDAETRLYDLLRRLEGEIDVVIIDAPGSDTQLSRIAHSFADQLITPMNDSFVDFDVLARVNYDTGAVETPSHYSEMVWSQKMLRAKRDGGSINWIVMRNRLGHAHAHNRKKVERALNELSSRIGFKLVSGFSERVIFRELFVQGLTLMDLAELGDGQRNLTKGGFSMSHVAARQEVRALVDALEL